MIRKSCGTSTVDGRRGGKETEVVLVQYKDDVAHLNVREKSLSSIRLRWSTLNQTGHCI